LERSAPPFRFAWVLLALLVALLSGIGLRMGLEGGSPSAADRAGDRESLEALPDPGEVFRRVVRLTLPSLVSVDAIYEVPSRIFGARPEVVQNVGGGVVVDPDGTIVTVYHVVSDAIESGEIVVTLHDGKSHLAKVVGVDEFTDLAVLQITAEGLVAAELGDSNDVRVGDVVLAFGNPLSFRETVTHGIVSGTGRTALDPSSVEDNMIQTDAAMNKGNSGGPLVDVRGRVIGINDYIASPTGTSAGLGFTIPINTVKKVLRDLRDKGYVAWGSLGVSVNDFVDDDTGELAGARVLSITRNSPAHRAGLQRGDVITGVDGHPVRAVRELRALTSAKEPGTRVMISFVRQGESKMTDAEITDRSRIMGAEPRPFDTPDR
jgi:S1-C subfamily serine protease